MVAAIILLTAGVVGSLFFMTNAPTPRACADGRGNDYYDGGAGKDTITFSCTTKGIVVDLSEGTAKGAEIGYDQVVNFEVVRAGIGDDVLLGSARADTLDGAEGDDRLLGRGGPDVLTGGRGADMFMFAARQSVDDIDEITDFEASDMIGIFGAEHPALTSPFDASQLAVGLERTNSKTRVIYEPSDGSLWYDPDGSGSANAEQFATLASQPPSLEPSQFQVVLELVLSQ